MKKVLKWIGIVLAALLGLLILAAVGLGIAGGGQLKKVHDIQAESITIPMDEASLARGEKLMDVAFCTSCHGEDLTGDVVFQDPVVGVIYASNITGLGEEHTDADLIRAIRHAVDHDGRQLMIMPADVFINLSAEDLGSIIAYLKTLPRKGDELPEPEITFMGRILMAAGMFGDVFPADYIDHDQPFPAMPEVGANIEYGGYMTGLCTGCHGTDLAGKVFDPEAPPAPNITPGGELGEWSEADFIQTLRTGKSPHEDHELDPEYMPWQAFSKLSDDELKALWMYLQSVPPKQEGDSE